MRKKNPWVAKRSSLGNFDFSSTLALILMGYGVYCLINTISDYFSRFDHEG